VQINLQVKQISVKLLKV